jgi:transcriptional regulator with XRE-family HTH domain
MDVIDQLRSEVKRAGVTRYRISQDTGIAEAILSRFVNGTRGLSMENIDALCRYLGLELRAKGKSKGTTKGR